MFQANNTRLNWLVLSIASALTLAGCGESTNSKKGPEFNGVQTPIETDFNEKALVINLADNVITPVYQQFNQQTVSQAELVNSYCQAEVLFGNNTDNEQNVRETKQAAQQGWSTAMATWQQAELMLLGPLLENDSLLRNSIYSWPIMNACAVDYDVVFFQNNRVNGQPYDITKRTPTRKGMAALEYLLFNTKLEDSCGSAPPDGWRNQTETMRKIARCKFATEVANDIVNSSNELLTKWGGDDGYANQLKTAGSANSDIASEHDAVNRLSDAMFYLDSSTKDAKLAVPLGLFSNSCGSQACPEAVESSHAMQSISHIVNNLKAFNDLLTGKDGIGFIEYLLDVNDQETANSMSADIQTAILDAQNYSSSLAQVLQSNENQVTETHRKVKAVTDKLKVDFINSLALELPQTSAGDND